MCNPHNDSTPPVLFSGYPLSDRDIIVRFFKPISDGYDYKLSYWIEGTSGQVTVLKRPTSFGPEFAKLAADLQPNTTYKFYLGLYCENTNGTLSDRTRIRVTTLPKCKPPQCLLLIITK